MTATDAVRLEEDATVDAERIRRLVLERIGADTGRRHRPGRRRVSRKAVIVLAVAVAVLSSALAANAATGGKLFGEILLTDDNRYLAKQPLYASYFHESRRRRVASGSGR